MRKALRPWSLAVALLLLTLQASVPGQAETPFQTGVKLYSQRDYRGAAAMFEQAMAGAPTDADAIYYCALSHQLANNRSRSRQLFEYILANFPNSRVAPQARTALNQLTMQSAPRSGSSGYSGSGSERATTSGSSTLAQVPDETRVPFEKHGNDVIVQVSVNGRPQNFCLDTGASSVVIGQNHLQEWGINKSESKDQFETSGVGEGKTRAWRQTLDLKLGQIYIRDCPVVVQESLPTDPLLGQTFLKNFNIRIDDQTRQVVLAKKGSSAATRVGTRVAGAKEVPFRRGSGGHLLVDVKVNNKPYTMIFDTGAESTCFSMGDWKKLGLDVPDGARRGISTGVQGDAVHYNVICDLQVGPMLRQDFEVHIIETAKSIPLLGMSFYGNMKYSIDTTRNVIVFTDE